MSYAFREISVSFSSTWSHCRSGYMSLTSHLDNLMFDAIDLLLVGELLGEVAPL